MLQNRSLLPSVVLFSVLPQVIIFLVFLLFDPSNIFPGFFILLLFPSVSILVFFSLTSPSSFFHTGEFLCFCFRVILQHPLPLAGIRNFVNHLVSLTFSCFDPVFFLLYSIHLFRDGKNLLNLDLQILILPLNSFTRLIFRF